MENEYLVNSADLTSVADAIREKGETTEQLIFPADFVTAIQNIKGGGELNFEVVGGTTQPSNPKENTIWVNTPNEITSWIFSATEPENPEECMVWISVGDSSPVSFNALTDNELQVYPVKVMHYIASGWELMQAKTYQDGEWRVWERILFESNNQHTDITGGWTSSGYVYYGSSYLTVDPTIGDTIYLKAVRPTSGSYGAQSCIAGTAKKINLKGFTKIVVVCTAISGAGLLSVASDPTRIHSSHAVASAGIEVAGTTELPIDLDGEYYIAVSATTSSMQPNVSMTISEVKLL